MVNTNSMVHSTEKNTQPLKIMMIILIGNWGTMGVRKPWKPNYTSYHDTRWNQEPMVHR